jgi:hypothetical protein
MPPLSIKARDGFIPGSGDQRASVTFKSYSTTLAKSTPHVVKTEKM